MAKRKAPQVCMNCGSEEPRLAAHSLCYKCYRAEERAEERRKETAIFDRHSPVLRKEHVKLLKAYSSLLTALSVLGVGRSDLNEIQRVIAPYVAPVAAFLRPPDKVEDCELESENETSRSQLQ